ncbi:hypothetical protein H6F74_13045 [Trichocoleus sp. FACHB-90]|jgi:hypothetical protein|uniref:DUF6753 family protein n=1 Tax=Cyanophyceae TaxID=3028117 RepID=UPI001688AF09|nr:DUF6753 family protein [Trichocoleus sp. FACHB-90]MBD1927164.1 hypothetical protein [Trichocoleus sp. FACHB-90]
MTDSEFKTRILLDAALEGKSDDFRRKVLDLVAKVDIRQNDPLFLVLIATGRLEVLLEEAPQDLEHLFAGWTQRMERTFDLAGSAILENQKLAIAKAAGDLIRTAERQEARRFFGSLMPAVLVLLSLLGLGIGMGATIPPYLQGGYVKETKLTADEVDALRWAKSSEGKFARNLMRWNSEYLDNLECVKDVKRLNVVLQLGSKPATDGFCTLWVKPPKERHFKD